MGISPTFHAVLGQGDRFDVLLVQKSRLGRIVAGLVAGAALGLAGCLTQTLTRNRLATPELLGVNDGATGAVLLSATLSASGTFVAWWAGPLGAFVAVIVVTAVSGGAGQRGNRVLVVGLAMSALASAVTQVVLSRRSLNSVSSLYVWTSGSLNGRGCSVAVPVLIGLAVLVPVALTVARHLAVLRFDDDTAASLGAGPARTRAVCLLLAVALAGLAVGVCGPVGFVALASPDNLHADGAQPPTVALLVDTMGRSPQDLSCSGEFVNWPIHAVPRLTAATVYTDHTHADTDPHAGLAHHRHRPGRERTGAVRGALDGG
ncbi:FecCD family ABC transporter permease [Streptomyces sp. NPDC017941]|uniref:FecCD family ABC transporter permease n=1 Tax=Streptomyces sp. NPDC017941 TaxID=3365018 RepID=UPI0037AF70E3